MVYLGTCCIHPLCVPNIFNPSASIKSGMRACRTYSINANAVSSSVPIPGPIAMASKQSD